MVDPLDPVALYWIDDRDTVVDCMDALNAHTYVYSITFKESIESVYINESYNLQMSYSQLGFGRSYNIWNIAGLNLCLWYIL